MLRGACTTEEYRKVQAASSSMAAEQETSRVREAARDTLRATRQVRLYRACRREKPCALSLTQRENAEDRRAGFCGGYSIPYQGG